MADGTVKIEVILDDSKVGGGVKKVEGRLSGIASTAKRGIATVGKLAGALGLVGLAYKGIDMVKRSLDGAIDRYDTLNNFPRVMQQIGFDADESQRAIDKLSDGIQGLPTRLDEVASTAQSIAIMTGDLDGAVDTTLALNNAFLASRASTEDAKRGLVQYVQMLAKGEVDLQSWRTLQETMPYALRKTAEAFGFTGEAATNDFYEALKSGKITFDEFNAKLIELDQAQGGFAETAQAASGGIRTAWTNLSTWIVTGVADVIGAIDEALGGTGSLEGAINSLKPVVQGVFGWIANTAIPVLAEGIKRVKGFIDEWLPSISEVKESFMIFFETLRGIAIPIFEEVVGFIMEVWGGLVEWWQEHGEMIAQAVENFMTVIWATMQALWPVIQFLIIDTWNAIKNVIQGAINIILGIIKTFAALFTGDWSGMWEGIKQLLLGAVQAIWGLINLWVVGKVLKLFKVFTKGGSGLIKGFIDKIINFFTTLVSQVRNIIPRMSNAIIKQFTHARSSGMSIVNALKAGVEAAFKALSRQVKAIWSTIQNSIITPIRNAYNSVINFLGKFRDAGRRIVTSIADGIKSAIGKVTSAISGITSKIRNFLPFSPAKEGPLKDLDKLDFGGTIAKSLARGEKKARQAMSELTQGLHDELKEDFPELNLQNRLRGVSLPLSGMMLSLATPATSGAYAVSLRPKEEQKIVIHPSVVLMDGREVGRIVWDPVKEEIDRDANIKEWFRG